MSDWAVMVTSSMLLGYQLQLLFRTVRKEGRGLTDDNFAA